MVKSWWLSFWDYSFNACVHTFSWPSWALSHCWRERSFELSSLHLACLYPGLWRCHMPLSTYVGTFASWQELDHYGASSRNYDTRACHSWVGLLVHHGLFISSHANFTFGQPQLNSGNVWARPWSYICAKYWYVAPNGLVRAKKPNMFDFKKKI